MNSFKVASAAQAATDMRAAPAVFLADADDGFRTAAFRGFAAHGLRADCFDRAEPLLNALRHCRPGCVVLDMHLPDRNSLELQELLTGQFHCMPLILVAQEAEPAAVVRAMRMGAHNFLLKPIEAEQLRAQVESALQSVRALSDREMLRETMRRRLRTLTAREYHILKLALTGRSNKEISNMLFISPRTVETHRSHIMEKIGITNLLELAHAFTDPHDWRAAPTPNNDASARAALPQEPD